ncbi:MULTISPECIES: hypothetical protein [unclassified Pseudomonas]|uniref:hypothetical protein n=1 Tax=unclassified Pseudomonas TaxID=196821 RepID=UPI001472D824|nr:MULTISPECIES: hypothetical protein [unclassified Pseudomonas]NMY38325.1 hypothetical protein [Pseudomonas sp. WS 5078]NMY61231.1 hypothetical protein [Pseudomonas sp. WS 5354]
MPEYPNKSHLTSAPESLRRAGDVEPFLTGRKTYLAPLPLPTDAHPYCPYISDINDVYLDFGGGKPNVPSYQLWLGAPFTFACFVAFGFPMISGFLAVLNDFSPDLVREVIEDVFFFSWPIAIMMWLFITAMCLFVWLKAHKHFTEVIPTRFNRQRREVCFTPAGATEPLFVPWESLCAWVIQSHSATQYGVTRQYGMGMGFEHEGEWVTLELQCAGSQLAIAHWEAVRAYMEYELDDFNAIQDPLELQEPNDPPHEGLHTFRNARAGLHRRLREKEVGWVYAFFWYLYHVMTFWTLPNRLVEWEIKRIEKTGRRALPQAMIDWSQPVPMEQRGKPSNTLVRLSDKVRTLIKQYPRHDITEIFAEVYRIERQAPDRR